MNEKDFCFLSFLSLIKTKGFVPVRRILIRIECLVLHWFHTDGLYYLVIFQHKLIIKLDKWLLYYYSAHSKFVVTMHKCERPRQIIRLY